LVGHAAPGRRHPSDFPHHLFRGLEARLEPEAVRQIDQDLEIARACPGLARLSGDLNAALVFTNVPVFSAKLEPGSTTSA